MQTCGYCSSQFDMLGQLEQHLLAVHSALVVELNFYIVRHLQFTTDALPQTASAEKISCRRLAQSARVAEFSLKEHFESSISRILELFVENQSKKVPCQLSKVYACNFSNNMLLENIFNFFNIAGSIYFAVVDFAVFCRRRRGVIRLAAAGQRRLKITTE